MRLPATCGSLSCFRGKDKILEDIT